MNRKESVSFAMNENSRTDWKRFLNMTDAEAIANALEDSDNPPLPLTDEARQIHLFEEDGTTLLERFRACMEAEQAAMKH